MTEPAGARIHITGIVQGVGFRPFVYALATRLALTGWVRNTSAGVDVEVDGPPEALAAFVAALRRDAPPLARIDGISVEKRPCNGYTGFDIVYSQAIPGAFQPISPDMCICPDCLRELFDPRDRRYRYPFINCTNCGPRFTIIRDIPYDRARTTMAEFEMCPDCLAEYTDPGDRRFHAQPVACPRCGPHVWLESKNTPGGEPRASGQENDDAIFETERLLTAGCIVAVKGLGGFHLACDATNAAAVRELRQRKLRVDKPFAVMVPDVATARAHCFVGAAERALLESGERPIVILKRRPESGIAREVAPGQDTIGVMLPYTPLHYLLTTASPALPGPAGERKAGRVLVMTSGNVSEEPIATSNEEARSRLNNLADAFLMHDRGIRTRCDDSVVRVFVPPAAVPGTTEDRAAEPPGGEAQVYPLRRARGYAPFPVYLPWDAPPLLATGAELKNTFCITRARYAFLSQHIGDLENYETLRSFQDGVAHLERLFRVHPEIVAYDLHPDYLATRYALERAGREGLPAVGVQHHHAHIAACMVEHGLPGDKPVIGVAFDGTGYGDDGAIWGGEFLVSDYAGYRRPFHLEYVPMPGGDRAVREPWRLALAWLTRAGLDWDEDLPPVRAASPRARAVIGHMVGVNSPLTSSLGRLFDAVAALAGVRQTVNYEAQAAIELEARAAAEESGAYEFEIPKSDSQNSEAVEAAPVIRAVVADLRAGVPVPVISARFHNGVAAMVRQVCRILRERTGLKQVALSGGVWQNMMLLTRTVALLQHDGFTVYTHSQVPANDGGLALGQAAVAACRRREL